jgi:hypothetical protein
MSKPRSWKRIGGAVGLVAAGAIAGGIIAGTVSAGAEEPGGGGSSAGASVDPSQPQRSDEELLTGDTKAQVEEAVLAEYPDATIERTETDSGGVYESHIVTADGEHLTVLVDEEFTVTGTEAGGGRGGPGGPGHRGGDADTDTGGSGAGTGDDTAGA